MLALLCYQLSLYGLLQRLGLLDVQWWFCDSNLRSVRGGELRHGERGGDDVHGLHAGGTALPDVLHGLLLRHVRRGLRGADVRRLRGGLRRFDFVRLVRAGL